MLRKGGSRGDSEAPTRAAAFGRSSASNAWDGKGRLEASASVGALFVSRVAKNHSVSNATSLLSQSWLWFEPVSSLFPLGALVSCRHWGFTLEASASVGALCAI